MDLISIKILHLDSVIRQKQEKREDQGRTDLNQIKNQSKSLKSMK